MREQTGASRIVSVGYHLPETRVTTTEMLEAAGAEKFGVTNNFIADTMGIHEVRHAADNQRPSDLAIAAAEQALAKTDINPDEIDLIIFCGIEGDYAEPSTAHIVQAALGLSGICFDVSNACLGFMTGVQIANGMIKAGSARYALVCTGEKLSRLNTPIIEESQSTQDKKQFLDKLGFLTVTDAGGATVLGPQSDGKGFIHFATSSVGNLMKLCYYKVESGKLNARMAMAQICSSAIKAHKILYRKTLPLLNWDSMDIDCLITHQVGKRPHEILSETFSVAPEKMTKTFDSLGNLTTATLPVNLEKAMEGNLVKSGDRLFIALCGSGLSTGHAGVIL